MSEPTQTCQICGAVEVVTPSGRAFPPHAARKRLAKRCEARGHVSDPVYRAGVAPDLMAALRASLDEARARRVALRDTDGGE